MEDNEGRINWYPVPSVPRIKADGANSATSYAGYVTALNNRLAQPTDLSIDITGSWDPGTRQVLIQATASTTSALPGNYALFIVLTESQVYYEGTNGIDWHEYTFRDAFPDFNGTPVTFSGEFPQTATAYASFVLPTGDPPHEYRPEFCDIVCLVQEPSVTKEVQQAAKVALTELGNTAVDAAPVAPRLGQNFPNPFNPTTTIPVQLADAGDVRLAIVDVTGRRLRTLHDGPLGAGDHALVWDGRDDSGQPVGSGVYLAQLVHAGGRESRRLVLMK